jgi:23S rRNA pseudouridine2605 synthase
MEEKDFDQESTGGVQSSEGNEGSAAQQPRRRPRISETRFREAGNFESRPAYMRNDAPRTDYQRPNEGYSRPSNNYQRDYTQGGRSEGYQPYQRPARPNTSYRRYDNGDNYQRPQQGGYQRPEYDAANATTDAQAPQEGGYSRPQQEGAYSRPQQGGYGRQQGGYGRQQGGYGRQQGGYNRAPKGNGYGRQGGYQQGDDYAQEGGYGRQQGGYNNRYNNQGGYDNNRFNNNQGGGYGRQQGGYGRQQQGGGYGRQQQGGGYGRQQGGYGRQQQGGYGRQQQGGGYGRQQRRGNGYNPHRPVEYQETVVDPNEEIRLNKFLANAGVCSRREADEYITKGNVKVNGEVVTELGTKVTRKDEILFNERPVSLERKIYVLLNKPKDTVTTSDDPQGRQTVMDLVRNAAPERIYPVGRLDRNTTGVLLLTNDGDLASKLTHPKYIKKKIYHVWLDKDVTAEDLAKIAAGVELEDGPIHADAIAYANDTDKNQVGIEIHSGKNRVVRRIFEHLGYRVVKLDRVYFAGLTKKNLPRGRWRHLTQQEVSILKMGAFE